MNELTPEHKAAVSSWIEAGESLSYIQKRLKEEFGISMTYLDTRLLMDDLKLQPKDPEVPADELVQDDKLPEPIEPTGSVSVSVDSITRPGSMISGKVTFADGHRAEWYLDQMGRLGLNPETEGHRPSQQDIMDFQSELQRQMQSPRL